MTATYEYGPSGMREYKSVTSQDGTSTTRSVWSGMQLLAELDSDGTRYEYVFGTSAPLELVVTTAGGTTTRYGYHTDAGGSVIAMTDQSGALVARYAYDPYGVPTAVEGGDIATRNPLRYRGYYYDAETGLYYLPARYYEPRSARFLSVDPAPPKAGDPVSLNRYAYCLGDPVNASDPTGAVTDLEHDSWRHYLRKASGNRSAAHLASSRFRRGARLSRSRRASDRKQGSAILRTQDNYLEQLLYEGRSNAAITAEALQAGVGASAAVFAAGAMIYGSGGAATGPAVVVVGKSLSAAGFSTAVWRKTQDATYSTGEFGADLALLGAGRIATQFGNRCAGSLAADAPSYGAGVAFRTGYGLLALPGSVKGVADADAALGPLD